MYRIETTDPITGKSLQQLVNMPYVVEAADEDSLVIYFESEKNRELYLRNPSKQRLQSGPNPVRSLEPFTALSGIGIQPFPDIST